MPDKEELLEISKLMREQDNRSTQYPIFIVVEKKKIYGVDENWSNGRERKEDYDEPLCDRCEAIAEGNGPDIPDECDDCPSDAFVYYREEDHEPNLMAGFFLTEKACKNHIEYNDYHYTKPSSYVVSAWRNPEMVAVMQSILKLTGEDLPSCYQ